MCFLQKIHLKYKNRVNMKGLQEIYHENTYKKAGTLY